jgi:hypothetical protein
MLYPSLVLSPIVLSPTPFPFLKWLQQDSFFCTSIESTSTSAMFTSFTLFIYPPLLANTLPLTWPCWHSGSSLFKSLLVVQWGFCLSILPVNILCLNQSTPPLLFLPFFSQPCNFQQFSVCFILSCSYTDVVYFIIHSLSFFSYFPPFLVSSNSPTLGNMFCIYLYVYMIVLVFVLDLSSTNEWERTCILCLSKSG